MLKISIGYGILFALIGAFVCLLVYAFFLGIKKTLPFRKQIAAIVLLVCVLIGAYVGGVTLGGTRIKKYDRDKQCDVSKCTEKAVYRISPPMLGVGFSPKVYCAEHLDNAKEYINTKTSYASSSKYDKDPWGNDKEDAAAFAWYIVGAQLKNPSSAKYSSLREMSIIYTNETWSVKGWVEAKNDFGATVRNNFTVKFKAEGKGDFTVTSCTIN